MHLTVDVHEREQVATHAAQVWSGHRDRGTGRDRSVDGVAAPFEHRDARRRGEVIGGRHQVVRGPDGGVRCVELAHLDAP